VGPRTGLDDVEKRKFLTLPGLELRPLCRPARSQSLYRLRYPAPYMDSRSYNLTDRPTMDIRYLEVGHPMLSGSLVTTAWQVAVGGDALQIWRVAANILNKQSRTADKGWPSSLGVGRGVNSSP
jgi:hypothetical protein